MVISQTQTLIQKFNHVYIDEESWNSKVAIRIREVFPSEKISKVYGHPFPRHKGVLSPSEFDNSKKQIHVTPFKGQFFKRCPGSRPGLMCCNYFVLNLGLQCDMNCSYCYLQSYINTPALTIYSNIEQAIYELKTMAKDLGSSKVRIGTGEVIDSLSLDPITQYSTQLVEAFYEFPNWTLEFKTKSNAIENLLKIQPQNNVIASWSINPQAVVEREEHGTATLKERLDAARACKDAGYQIAFHLDPMIWHENWTVSYAEMATQIQKYFAPHEINIMSIGTLRFQPEQRSMMKERFGMKSWVNQGESFVGHDGKLRYDQNLRTQMYQFLIEKFKSHSPDWRIFLCMENPETWITTMDQVPQKQVPLQEFFDSQVLRNHRQWAKEQNTSRPD